MPQNTSMRPMSPGSPASRERDRVQPLAAGGLDETPHPLPWSDKPGPTAILGLTFNIAPGVVHLVDESPAGLLQPGV
jgi:hypothetical protein